MWLKHLNCLPHQIFQERTVRPAGQLDKKWQSFKNHTDLSSLSSYVTTCLQTGFCTPHTFVCSKNLQRRRKVIHTVIKIKPFPLHKTCQPKYLDRISGFIVGWEPQDISVIEHLFPLEKQSPSPQNRSFFWRGVCIIILVSSSCSCCIQNCSLINDQKILGHNTCFFFLTRHELGHYSKRRWAKLWWAVFRELCVHTVCARLVLFKRIMQTLAFVFSAAVACLYYYNLRGHEK